jgi:hypothetical protein
MTMIKAINNLPSPLFPWDVQKVKVYLVIYACIYCPLDVQMTIISGRTLLYN